MKKIVMDGIVKLAQEIVKGFTQEEMENCDGYKLSNCCGAFIDSDIPICSDCKEHATNECSECDAKDCPNRVNLD